MDTQLYSHTSKSPIEKRSVIIMGHRTSVSQEKALWAELKRIAKERDIGIMAQTPQADRPVAHHLRGTSK